LWGYGGCTGQVAIIIGYSRDDVSALFGSVTAAARVRCANCAEEESDLTIYVCRQPRVPMAVLWRRARHFN
ncbi:MAG TPA: hypothetical protein VGR57_15145, partial [Ktedonobacterales bacterium]|nr:hypothetical protein [Ktedonobacterales bacterium]